MTEIEVPSGAGIYRVVVTRTFDGLREALPAARGVLVTEETVGPLHAAAVSRELGARVRSTVVLPAGEDHKSPETWARCVDGLLAAPVDRTDAVIALGGGVLGDLAGFAAATTLRGLGLVQLPTTLLAMVDSSVGGKTGVNHPLGKNLIGAFHAPSLVWIAVDTLDTLPPAELRCGLGEVVKTGLAADADLLAALEGDLGSAALGDRDALAEIVVRCVRIKAAIVGADERDAGPRLVLNAGHTVGHGIEAALGPGVMRHGEAVAIGLVAEARFAVATGVCTDPALPDRLVRLLRRLGLSSEVPDMDRARFLAAMGLDKKTAGDKIRLPLPVRAGEMILVDLPRTSLHQLVPGSYRD